MLWIEAVFGMCVLVLSDPWWQRVVSLRCFDVDVLQDIGATPLYVGSQEGHDVVVAALLASGPAVNQATTVGVGS